MKISWSTLLLSIIGLYVHAQNSENKPVIEWSGYTEVYYGYDFNQPDNHDRPGFLFNHDRHNEFNINLAFLKSRVEGAKTRASLAFMAGTYANANLAGEPGVLKNLFEAQAGIRLAPKWWLDAGIFPSHIGFESAISKDCRTLTRSLAAENSPYYESGAKVTYTPDETWTVTALILNGWQRIRRENGNSGPAMGLQITRSTDRVTLNYSAYAGPEFPDNMRRWRIFHNLYGIMQINEWLEMIAGLDLGTQQNLARKTEMDIWFTPVIIAKCTLNDRFSLAARAEYYEDVAGVIIASDTYLQGYSLNLDYEPAHNVLVRLEGRLLQNEDRIFQTKSGLSASNFSVMGSMAVSF